ncbi:hypothetical protein [Enterococcus olivae]
MYADKKKIEWLLFESKLSLYNISKNSGVPLTTVNDLANKRTKIERMRFDNASKLTEYAGTLKEFN